MPFALDFTLQVFIKILAKKKLGAFGINSEIRPFVTIVNGKNIFIGKNVALRPGTQLYVSSKIGGAKIVIEDDVLVAPNVFISVNNHNYFDVSKPIKYQGGTLSDVILEKGSWIGVGVIILPEVTIGINSVVATGAVVTHNIPAYSVVAGIPAKIIEN